MSTLKNMHYYLDLNTCKQITWSQLTQHAALQCTEYIMGFKATIDLDFCCDFLKHIIFKKLFVGFFDSFGNLFLIKFVLPFGCET